MLFSMKDDMIYTSYFGNINRILNEVPEAGLVSIAGKTPNWFKGEKFKTLAPRWSWWNEWHCKFEGRLESKESREWYTSKYYSTVLSKLDQLDTARKIKDLARWKPTFILCYEAPGKFCHRHIVADWLGNACIDCEEWRGNA